LAVTYIITLDVQWQTQTEGTVGRERRIALIFYYTCNQLYIITILLCLTAMKVFLLEEDGNASVT